jgi:hypothetical protein
MKAARLATPRVAQGFVVPAVVGGRVVTVEVMDEKID